MLVVGMPDGFPDGREVGMYEGCRVGSLLGSPVGCPDGIFDGSNVGGPTQTPYTILTLLPSVVTSACLLGNHANPTTLAKAIEGE